MSAEATTPTTASSDAPANANEHCVGPQSSEAGKAASCQGCPNQGACASGEGRQTAPDPAIAAVAARLQQVSHVLLVLSGKGGVGKSSVSSQLAWRLSGQGFNVGLLDIDICGPSVPRMTGVESAEVQRTAEGWAPVWADDRLCVMSIGFMLATKSDAVIWRGPRKNGLIKQFLTDVTWDQLDFLIIDAPPGTSDEHLSIISYLAGIQIRGAVVVTTPQEVALLDVRKEINFCKKTKIPILGVIENMAGFVCPCCKTKSDIFPAVTGGAAGMCAEMSVPLLGSLPIDPNFLRSCEDGVDFVKTYPTSIGVGSFNAFVDAVLNSTPELQKTKQQLREQKDKNDQ